MKRLKHKTSEKIYDVLGKGSEKTLLKRISDGLELTVDNAVINIKYDEIEPTYQLVNIYFNDSSANLKNGSNSCGVYHGVIKPSNSYNEYVKSLANRNSRILTEVVISDNIPESKILPKAK